MAEALATTGCTLSPVRKLTSSRASQPVGSAVATWMVRVSSSRETGKSP